MIIKNAKYFDDDFKPAYGDIKIEGDTITEFGGDFASDRTIIDAKGDTVIPGLIDVHIHGCYGADVGDATHSAITRMAKFLASRGVTAFVPTAISDSTYRQKLQAEAVLEATKFPFGARILAFRTEGSFLSPERPGAHPVELLREPNIEEIEELGAASGGMLKIIDIAPELEGAFEFIEEAKQRGYILSLAHSDTDYYTATMAFQAGVTNTTHLFNAMSGFNHRAPGVVGAVFDTDQKPFVELIADGNHVHPAVCRTALKLIGSDRLILISDACSATGMPDGNYPLGKVNVKVVNGVARNDQGALSGSTSTVMDCFKSIISMGIPFDAALRAASINPARLLGISKQYGSIALGKKADIVILDGDMEVKRVIINGKPFNKGLV